MIVLAKQVPDTRNVGKDAMKADGTVNRAALPAIFNPEDLNALEQALGIKERFPGSTITLLTMGPSRAADILREGLFRGADDGVLLTDRAFAGADTLATSYALSMAIREIGPFDLIIAGRQAIDGDTAQVGPQVAEKLGIPQVTYTESIEEISKEEITVKRRLDNGVEIVKAPLPLLVTVNGTARPCRPRNAKLLMKYKHAKTATERQTEQCDRDELYTELPLLAPYRVERGRCQGRQGAVWPRRFTHQGEEDRERGVPGQESKRLTDDDNEIDGLMRELIESHTIG